MASRGQARKQERGGRKKYEEALKGGLWRLTRALQDQEQMRKSERSTIYMSGKLW